MIEIVDRVKFTLPIDAEMQFPAVAALQVFVNTYDDRMKVTDPTGGRYKFNLQYEVIGSLDFFMQAGLTLDHSPQVLDSVPDMVVDMSDNALNRFQGTKRHCGQICGMLCGIQSPISPSIRRVVPKKHDFIWWYTNDYEEANNLLLRVQDNEISGVIGYASKYTYLAASMGLPVVEIVPVDRQDTWLSKFSNLGYRLVRDTGNNLENKVLTDRAMSSIELELVQLAKKEVQCSMHRVEVVRG